MSFFKSNQKLVLGVMISFALVLFLPFLGPQIGETPLLDLVMHWRLPRALNAWLVGASLGIAGVVMQTLTRNPLADPYILGVTGAAALGYVLSMVMGFSGVLRWFLPLILASGVLVVLLKSLGHGKKQNFRLLLLGVALASLMGSLTSLVLILAPAELVKPQLFFLFGQVSYGFHLGAWLLFFAAFAVLLAMSRHLDLIGQSHERAFVEGVPIKKVTCWSLMIASFISVMAVLIAGPIGMVGFLSGHVARSMVGSLHKKVFMMSASVGGVMALASDTLARSVIYPQEIPVGIVINILALPLYVYVLRKS